MTKVKQHTDTSEQTLKMSENDENENRPSYVPFADTGGTDHMTTKAVTPGVLPIIPEEIEEFEHEVKRFESGGWDPDQFMA